MELEVARSGMTNYIRHEFGKIIELREVTVVRHAVGRVWSADLYCVTKYGEVHVGKLEIDDQGVILRDFTVDDLIKSFRQIRLTDDPGQSPFEAAAPKVLDEFSDFSLDDDDFGGMGDDEENDDDLRLSTVLSDTADPAYIQGEVNKLIATGEPANLEEARNLLPRLLSETGSRGRVLKQMGEVEALIGDRELALNFLEAAAREFSDKAELAFLRDVAEMAGQLMALEQYEKCTVKMLLERAEARMQPIEMLGEAPIFVGLADQDVGLLRQQGEEVSLSFGEDLMREGAPAIAAYVIKSGALSIRIESPEGGSKVVRSCFPGDFIGESSVLGPEGATCTATVRAETTTHLWRFDGVRLRELLNRSDEIRLRVESAKTLHQLDSFMSTHEITSQLNVQVRDQMLSCINGMRRIKQGAILEPAGELPSLVYLIAEGQLEYHLPGGAVRLYETNSFACLRDTLHALALEGEFKVKSDGLVITFEPEGLKSLAADATPEVVAILERLE